MRKINIFKLILLIFIVFSFSVTSLAHSIYTYDVPCDDEGFVFYGLVKRHTTTNPYINIKPVKILKGNILLDSNIECNINTIDFHEKLIDNSVYVFIGRSDKIVAVTQVDSYNPSEAVFIQHLDEEYWLDFEELFVNGEFEKQEMELCEKQGLLYEERVSNTLPPLIGKPYSYDYIYIIAVLGIVAFIALCVIAKKKGKW